MINGKSNGFGGSHILENLHIRWYFFVAGTKKTAEHREIRDATGKSRGEGSTSVGLKPHISVGFTGWFNGGKP